jgi:bifunctional pyridoxal-dependent enzyme with beta-cystathionase and maltose regulon repressor activities
MRLNAACPRSVLDTALGRIAAAVGSPLRRYANA